LNYQQDLEVLENTQKVLFERMGELEKRQVIGKSRPSEVASAEAKLRRNEAAVEVVRAQKEVAGQLVEFLIGKPFERLVEEDIPTGDQELQSLYLKADDRADVVAARENFAAYKNNITAARSSFLPTVTLSGNAYTKRGDTYEGNDWDATLAVNVPLFNGLSDVGQVAQARAQANAADLRLSQVKRKALLEVRNVHTKWLAAEQKLKAFVFAAEASARNYQLQEEDFQKSLVSNLDVLQALEDLQSARRDVVAARTDLARSYWAVKVSTGEIK
jgi:outer membrane protein